jgi:hypothetical protein
VLTRLDSLIASHSHLGDNQLRFTHITNGCDLCDQAKFELLKGVRSGGGNIQRNLVLPGSIVKFIWSLKKNKQNKLLGL